MCVYSHICVDNFFHLSSNFCFYACLPETSHRICKPAYLVPVPSQDKLGGLCQEGHLAIGAPTSAIPTIFTPGALPGTTLPIFFGLGQAPNMLACIPSGLVRQILSVLCQSAYVEGNAKWRQNKLKLLQ